MADLNLDGLNLLQEACSGPSMSYRANFRRQLEKLVERERIEQARGDLAEINRAAERLPAWAKPVMRAVKRWDDTNGSWNGMWEIMIEHRKLTEAQLKEIGEDDG